MMINLLDWAHGAFWLYRTLLLNSEATPKIYMTSGGTWAIRKSSDLFTFNHFDECVVERRGLEALVLWNDPSKSKENFVAIGDISVQMFEVTDYISWLEGAQTLMVNLPLDFVGYDPKEASWICHHTNGKTYNLPTSILPHYVAAEEIDVYPQVTGLTTAISWYSEKFLKSFNGPHFKLETVGTPTIQSPAPSQPPPEPPFALKRSYTHGNPPMPKVVREQMHKAMAMQSLRGAPDTLIHRK